jgi:nicotinamidase-related amidase
MRSALLVMDVQVGIVNRLQEGSAELLHAIGQAAAAARSAGTPVVYVRVAFRPNVPEISRRNRSFAALLDSPTLSMGEDDADTQIHPALAPHAEDVVVLKKRVSAFAGSDLDVVLRSLDVDELVLTGITTSGVVLSTLRHAADLDFGLLVLRDGCTDRDPEVHRVLMEKVFPRQAEVLTASDWAHRLEPDD